MQTSEMFRKAKLLQESVLTAEQVVSEYFRLISARDIHGILQLFTDDAVLYEPFSKENGLHGKYSISQFLKVAVMANAGLQKTIQFIDKTADSIVALVTFERGDSVKGRFEFQFTDNDKKIKELKIKFI